MINYPLAESTWDEKETEALQEVIQSGFFTMGVRVAEFERQFAQYVGSQYAVMVNSGSSANLLAVAALFYRSENPLQAGDEVIVPAVSWSTSYFPLSQYGLKLKFVDIDLQTLNYDMEALEAAISDNTRMILVVNLLGNPNQFDRLQTLVQGRDITLMEDNCESMGATFQGKQAGTFGVMGTFSTFFSHHISTMEGGLVVTDDEELYHLMLSLRTHGWTRNLPQENRLCEKSDNAFEESFRFILPGYNLRPLEMSGALGIHQLQKLPGLVEMRRKNAAKFQELFTDHPLFLIQQEVGQSSWFGFSLIMRPGSELSREQVLARLSEHKVDSRPIVAGNFAKNEVIKHLDHTIPGELENADYLDKNGFFLGNHHIDVAQKLEAIHQLF
ncbi:MAG TPA: pyridoxamine 5-phosphate oxidase [Cytophagales bacterium]|nr:pyridoxamine 5-phosphate oxidase [Cytophagales bacterium]HAP64571.1 pyridoxamine 5-phosphate oxidase [Cytophagales bacterium]